MSTVDPAIGMFSDGVITRSVRDTAGLVDAILANDSHWPAPPFGRPLSAEVGAPVERLRVGVWVAAFNGTEVDSECAHAALACALTLERAGHHVSSAAPVELSHPSLWDAMGVALASNAATELATWEQRLGRPIGEDDLEPVTWRIIAKGRGHSAVEVLGALAEIQQLTRQAASWWDEHDLLITPAAVAPPQPIGTYLSDYQAGRGSAFTRPFNATGQPAIVVPLGWPDDGLPRGVQLVSRFGREDLLIRVASFLEADEPWWHRYAQLGTLRE